MKPYHQTYVFAHVGRLVSLLDKLKLIKASSFYGSEDNLEWVDRFKPFIATKFLE
jgi:hypothetical protein